MLSALRTLRRSAGLAGLLAVQVAAVVALYRLGSRPPFAVPFHHLGPWLRLTAPADVLVAALRLVALAGASWLLLGTVLYAVACLTRVPGAVRATGRLTLPSVRRIVDGALAASLVAGATFGGAGLSGAGLGGVAFADTVVHRAATDPPPTTVAVRDGRAGGRGGSGAGGRGGSGAGAGGLASLPAEPSTPTSTTRPRTTSPTTTPGPRPTTSGQAPAIAAPTPSASTTTTTGPSRPVTPAPLPTAAAPTPAPTATPTPAPGAVPQVIVAPGDNLWELTAAYLARSSNRTRDGITDAEIAPYWVAVCEQNRATLRSGDPDRIYPGEVVTFPPGR